MIKVILTWLTIGVPVSLLALWDALPGGQRGQAAADPATAEEDPADWRTWPAIWP